MVTAWSMAASLAMSIAAAPPQLVDSGQNCRTILPARPSPATKARPLVADDLLRLRDIGYGEWPYSGSGALALSPNGKSIAFQIRQADPVHNRYCLAMVTVRLDQGSDPVVIDSGGDLLRESFTFRGKAGFPTGTPVIIAPQWSADGTWVAFLKRTEGKAQVWRARADGSGSMPVTHSSIDVEAFRVANDGKSIYFATRPALEAARLAIEQEGLTGNQFDGRFSPMTSSRPFPAPPIGQQIWVQDIEGGSLRIASGDEKSWLSSRDAPATSAATFTAAGLRLAWVGPDKDRSDTTTLHADDAMGVPVKCAFDSCTDLRGAPWWTEDRTRVRYFRREGWAGEATAIYEWSPGPSSPQLLYRTNDLITDCLVHGMTLLCLEESSSRPRRIASIDLAGQKSTIIFDPNPEFQALLLGKVERLRWRNAAGLEVFGDMVLPVNYQAGQRLPLVIVQYESRGFLRGGTGDEFPIQAFANRGYVVLSINRPVDIGKVRGGLDPIAIERINLTGFADRKSVLSALETGVEILTRRGIVDPAKVGITGLSDGTSTVQFALASGRNFAAASATGCCWEDGYQAFVGPTAAAQFEAMGFPKLTDNRPDFWKAYSLLPNIGALRTPLLIQSSDDEYLNGITAVTALREWGKPVDIYVFPGEHHVKWQPAHRLAVYKRNLAWFDFWVKGVKDVTYDQPTELALWSAMATTQKKAASDRAATHAAQ